MQTVSSLKSLILFDQNRSDSNVFSLDGVDDVRLFCKPHYENLFSGLAEELKTKQYTSFVKLWHKLCDSECEALRGRLAAALPDKNRDGADRVTAKFRGNCGEIFAEAFFLNGLASEYVDGSTYRPVDPTNERFIDADVKSAADGLPMGVQVKNYASALVKGEIFNKAAAEDMFRLRIDGIVRPEDFAAYLSTPRQIIFSFTSAEKFLIENNSRVVLFLGPDFIDRKKLHGDVSKNVPARWRMFEQIAEEIKEVK